MSTLVRYWAAAAALTAALPAWAADHREAPRISEFPPADINDIYAFEAPDNANRVVLVMTVNPISDPEFAGTYVFSPRVRYRFWIDNDADARLDSRIDFTFSEPSGGAQTFVGRFPNGIVVRGDTTRPTVLSDTPNDPVIESQSGVQVFAGPRDDPFFFDGVGFNRFVAGAGTFSGDDSFADHNVSAIVTEFPKSLLGDADGEIEIAGLTIRRRAGQYPEDDRRLDRTGIPALSSALVPSSMRDDFNQGLFKNDAEDFADVLVATLQAPPFETPDGNIAILAGLAVPDTLKFDLDAAYGFLVGERLATPPSAGDAAPSPVKPDLPPLPVGFIARGSSRKTRAPRRQLHRHRARPDRRPPRHPLAPMSLLLAAHAARGHRHSCRFMTQ